MLDPYTRALLLGANTTVLADTCILISTPVIDDGAGGSYPDTAHATTVMSACRFTPVAAIGDNALRQQVNEFGSYLLELPLTQTVRVTDTVTYKGKTYAVTWAPVTDYWAFVTQAALKDV